MQSRHACSAQTLELFIYCRTFIYACVFMGHVFPPTFLICRLIAKLEVNRRLKCTSEPVRDLCCRINALEDYTLPGLFTLLLLI